MAYNKQKCSSRFNMKSTVEIQQTIGEVLNNKRRYGAFLGCCQEILQLFPPNSIDCVITSPPYWQLREYDIADRFSNCAIGNEETPEQYVEKLVDIFQVINKLLKPGGSFWLNLGDKYQKKNLMGMPWRVALALQESGWTLRNAVVWEKIKGTQSAKDRLRDVHEFIFHFVKSRKYYYDADQIRIKPRLKPTVTANKTVSATGVSGKKYRRQILQSAVLSETERLAALEALDETLQQIRDGKIVDFRMTIRGEQRTLHSNNGSVSGRAKELENKGFFIMKSGAKGYLPSDVWRIVPEDKVKNREKLHYAVFPIELLEIPIKATCPDNGILLDPFMGTGSTIAAGLKFGKRSFGMDISKKYFLDTVSRLDTLQLGLPI